jgi:hypothetical protein
MSARILGLGFSSLASISFVYWQKIGISAAGFFDDMLWSIGQRFNLKNAAAESARHKRDPEEGPAAVLKPQRGVGSSMTSRKKNLERPCAGKPEENRLPTC